MVNGLDSSFGSSYVLVLLTKKHMNTNLHINFAIIIVQPSSNPYSADFIFIIIHFDIQFCLGISRKGSIYLFVLFQFL